MRTHAVILRRLGFRILGQFCRSRYTATLSSPPASPLLPRRLISADGLPHPLLLFSTSPPLVSRFVRRNSLALARSPLPALIRSSTRTALLLDWSSNIHLPTTTHLGAVRLPCKLLDFRCEDPCPHNPAMRPKTSLAPESLRRR